MSSFDAVGYGLKAIYQPNDRYADISVDRYIQEGNDSVTSSDAYTKALMVIFGVRMALSEAGLAAHGRAELNPPGRRVCARRLPGDGHDQRPAVPPAQRGGGRGYFTRAVFGWLAAFEAKFSGSFRTAWSAASCRRRPPPRGDRRRGR
ncbi:MAG: hypothetical protein U1F87_11300 [Kiritimatiellia bacterium]